MMTETERDWSEREGKTEAEAERMGSVHRQTHKQMYSLTEVCSDKQRACS